MKIITHDLSHDLIFYCTHNQLCVPPFLEYLGCITLKPGSKFDEFGWSVESETFPIYAKLLNLPEYCEKVLLGLVISVGGVTERLVRQSSLYMFKELENMNSGQLTEFGQMLIKIFTVSIKVSLVFFGKITNSVAKITVFEFVFSI